MLSWTIFKNYMLSKRSGALVRIIARQCIFGIGMGVCALIIVLSVMKGFNQSIRTKMLGLEPHLVFSGPTAANRDKLIKDLQAALPGGIEQVSRYHSQDLIIRSVDGVFNGVAAKGYEGKALNGLLQRVWRNGRQYTAPPMSETPVLEGNELILGVDLGRSLEIFEGDEVVLVPPETLLLPKGEIPKLQKFKVKMLLSTQIPEVDARLLLYNLETVRGLQSRSLETGIEVRLHDPSHAEKIKAILAPRGYKVQTWADRDVSLFFALKLESMAMTLFLLLAVLITSFSIVIVMILLMSQKRQDIGMLMALGLSRARIRSLFLQVGLFLSFSGILSGFLLGTGITLFLEKYPLAILPDIYTDSTLPAKVTAGNLLFVLGCSAAIAILGAVLPVWRYVRGMPAENLRKRMT
jgi:lipoprotein-releasing system permease protein